MNWLLKALWLVCCLGLGVGLVHQMKSNQKTEVVETCKHLLLKSQCAFCDPTLIDSLGFCHGHGVPEAFCTRCSPHLIPAFKLIKDWCNEHLLPISQCQVCKSKPTVSSKPFEHNKGFLKIGDLDGINSKSKPNPECKNDSRLIRLESPKITQFLSFGFGKVQNVVSTDSSYCKVSLVFNENQIAHITPRVGGTVLEVMAVLGSEVTTDEVLSRIHSEDFAKAKSNYLQALALFNLWKKNHQVELELQESGATSKRSLLETETKMVENQILLNRAIQELLILGLTESQIQSINNSKSFDSSFEIIAPFAGIIVESHAVLGESVSQSHTMFKLVNTNKIWGILDLYPNQIPLVSIGNSVQIQVSELPDQLIKGQISWISSQIDPHSRTLKARVELDNPSNLFKSGMMGRARIDHSESRPKQFVPREAVQWDGCCNVLFLRVSETEFKAKKVQIRESNRHPKLFELLNSLDSNSEFVTKGSFLLKTELMKESIGAGCCEVEPGE